MLEKQIGEKVILRPISKQDTNLIVKWRNNARVQNNFIFQERFTQEIHNQWLDTKVASGEVVQFIIVEMENQEPVGSVYLRDIDYKAQKAEYGIFIGEDEAVGKGYGTEVAKLIINYAFGILNLERIYLKVFADNITAIQSYKNAGFKEIDYVKNAIEKKGKKRDLIFMAIEAKKFEKGLKY